MPFRETIALILAGGQGSRLGVLTKRIAKPAVLYGGKYRIIDFTLSNCINSGIDTVGVLTQYQPHALNSHIGIGKPWDMDRMHGGVTILSPYLKSEMGEWYKGTANAVLQNISYIDSLSPSYVVILSGDHIYKMDYSEMLDFHKNNKADVTISVIKVPMQEAHRYGIMNCRPDGKIIEFEEKPKQPKSTLASMGVYIFDWDILRSYLLGDEKDESSNHDFGKNIIPLMLSEGRSMWAFRFDGYWRDVGTIQAYWESNMDLIERVPSFNLFDPTMRTYTPNPVKPAHYIGRNGNVQKSIVAEGCMIYGMIKNSVIFPGVVIGEGTTVEGSIIMSDSRVGSGAYIARCIAGERVLIGNNCRIGENGNTPNEYKPDIYNSGITVIGDDAHIPGNISIGRNVMIDTDVSEEDFKSGSIPSGSSIFKGGVPA